MSNRPDEQCDVCTLPMRDQLAHPGGVACEPIKECSIEQLRKLTDIQADDPGLWDAASIIHAGYIQAALRLLTSAVEGQCTFEQARDAIREMMP